MPDVVKAAAEMAVLRCLELAGNRLLALRSRQVRGQLREVAPWGVHTKLRIEEHELDKVLVRAWDLPREVGFAPPLIDALDRHVRILLAAGKAFDRADLRMSLARLSGEGFVTPWTDAAPNEDTA